MALQHLARLLLTILVACQGLGTPAIDLNRTHAGHPLWPGHARFHVVWQSLTQALLSAVTLALVWSPRHRGAWPFYLAVALAAVPCLGFVLAQSLEPHFGATLSDPGGIPPLAVRFGGKVRKIDGNAAAVYCALATLAGAVALFRCGS